jgi:uncharacterized protein (UPF0147 family)/signal transduction histidine kinase
VRFVEELRSRIGQSLGRLSLTSRIAVILLAGLVVGGLVFWLCAELVYFFIARSYTRELADAYDLSRGVTRVVLWVSFAAIVVFAGFTLSFSKQERRIGYAGLLSLIIGHSLLLGRIDANFRKNGTAEKCYVMTRTSIKTLNRIGTDPDTGLECRPPTPQIVEKLEEYKNGHRPVQIRSNDPKFFDAVTGEPVIWYSKNDQGEIELFDLMGFHPKTGEELTPITRQAAEDWNTQNENAGRRAAGRIADPDGFGFFDPVTGAAKVWYWRSKAGDYEFYDGPGYHSGAGDQFKAITREVIADWRQGLEVVVAKRKQEQQQCYVTTRTTIKTLSRIGIDPDTGLECRPLTPQIAEKLEEYRSGHRPAQITSNDPKFFDAVTGEPVIWYSKNDQGEIELFDLMGFHPKTGEELTPITRQAAEEWRTQNENAVRRAAGRIADPDGFGFFDAVTGAAKVWYWRSEAGDYEFYDGPGFHSRAGNQFKVITREVIADWRQRLEVVAANQRAEQEQTEREARQRAERDAQQAREAAERDRLAAEAAADALQRQQQPCYVMTRTTIKTLNRIGIDPDTGLECRPLTPQIIEKLEEYRSGHRPTQITSNDPRFFDAVTGEPVIWYSKSDQGEIELFDLMGFHPKTGEELIPITRQVAEDWKTQNENAVRRAAGRVADPDGFGFFDPVTGAAKVWYWRSEAGDYEFYDGPGYHSRAGDQLKVITREVIADWRQRLKAIAANQRAEQEQREREARQRAERDAQQARQAAERDRLAAEAAAHALQEQQRSASECDRLAANPTDRMKASEGVPFDLLKNQANQAFDSCSKAVQTFPSELRYQYQLGRAAQFKDKKQAFDVFTRLVQANYAAAFDNLGGMYLYDRKDIAAAIRLFKRGSELGDADSMVSLVDLIERGLISIPNPEQTKLALLKRAAELGHSGAQRAYESELQKANQAGIDQANQRQMMQIFGAFIQGLPRR